VAVSPAFSGQLLSDIFMLLFASSGTRYRPRVGPVAKPKWRHLAL
jgi:hypothetical protein